MPWLSGLSRDLAIVGYGLYAKSGPGSVSRSVLWSVLGSSWPDTRRFEASSVV